MYVRLKHTLSSLALEMLAQSPRNRSIAWLLAYSRLATDGGGVSEAELRRTAATIGAAGPRALRHLEVLGILQREGSAQNGSIRLAPEFLPHRDYFHRQVRRLAKALAALDRQTGRRRSTALQRGIALFNAGLFFECHEFLENIWRATAGPDRDFYHGIIQVAAAFYHFEKGNQHGARTLLGKAVAKLDRYRPRHLGVDVRRLLSDLEPWQRRFSAGSPGQPLVDGDAPVIRVRATI